MNPEENYSDVTLSAGTGVALPICIALTSYLGLFPSQVLSWTRNSAINAFSLLL